VQSYSDAINLDFTALHLLRLSL